MSSVVWERCSPALVGDRQVPLTRDIFPGWPDTCDEHMRRVRTDAMRTVLNQFARGRSYVNVSTTDNSSSSYGGTSQLNSWRMRMRAWLLSLIGIGVSHSRRHYPVAPPPAAPPFTAPDDTDSLLVAAEGVSTANVTQWASKEQAVLDECRRWMDGTRGTWTLAPKSARVLGGFTSQYRQDKNLWKAIFNSTTSNRAPGGRPRVYAEVAANHYKSISNSYFFDRCLHWRGLCVEPNPVYHADLRSERTCALTATCVADHTKEIDMILPNSAWHGARGGVADSHFVTGFHVAGTKPVRRHCVRLQDEFDRLQFNHIDILFLDLEGYEDSALRGINFEKTRIDTIMCESACEDVLPAHGYHKIPIPGWLPKIQDRVWQRSE